jgi:hypothetical protein
MQKTIEHWKNHPNLDPKLKEVTKKDGTKKNVIRIYPKANQPYETEASNVSK